jgi:Helix-turn-helix domain
MSIKALRWTWGLSLPSEYKFVLIALADRADEANTCFPSISNLQRMTGQRRATILEALRELAAAGLIKINPGNRRRSNHYVLALGATTVGREWSNGEPLKGGQKPKKKPSSSHAKAVPHWSNGGPQWSNGGTVTPTVPPLNPHSDSQRLSAPRSRAERRTMNSARDSEIKTKAGRQYTAEEENAERLWVESAFRQLVQICDCLDDLHKLDGDKLIREKVLLYQQRCPELFERMKQIYETHQAELSQTIWATEAMVNCAKRSGWNPEYLANHIMADMGEPTTAEERRQFRDRWYALCNSTNEGVQMLKDRA